MGGAHRPFHPPEFFFMAKRKFQIGDRVRYTRPFLQVIQAQTGWYPQARGEITRFSGDLAFICWENPSGVNDPQCVNTFNLEKCR